MRRAVVADIQVIAVIHLAAEIAAAVGTSREDVVKAPAQNTKIEAWTKTFNNPTISIFVETEAEEIKGFAAVGDFRSENTSETGIAEIHTIFVDPKYFRQGVATRLFAHCRQAPPLNWAKSIRLWVYQDNTMARRFYEKMRFQLTTVFKDIKNDGVISRAVLYELTI